MLFSRSGYLKHVVPGRMGPSNRTTSEEAAPAAAPTTEAGAQAKTRRRRQQQPHQQAQEHSAAITKGAVPDLQRLSLACCYSSWNPTITSPIHSVAVTNESPKILRKDNLTIHNVVCKVDRCLRRRGRLPGSGVGGEQLKELLCKELVAVRRQMQPIACE